MHKLAITYSVDVRALKKRPPCGLETSGKKHPLTKYNTTEECTVLLCSRHLDEFKFAC